MDGSHPDEEDTMTNRTVQEQGPINESGSDPAQDDQAKGDKSLEASTDSCSGVDAGCGSDVGTVDTGKIDKGI